MALKKTYSKKTYYKGSPYQSKLEGRTAMALDALGLDYSYESIAVIGCEYRDGRQYTPDFYVPSLNLILECNGKVDDEHLRVTRLFCGATPYSGVIDHREGDGTFLIVGDDGILHDPFYTEACITVRLGSKPEFRLYDGSRTLFESVSIIDLGCKVRCRNSHLDMTSDGVSSAMKMLSDGKPFESARKSILESMEDMFRNHGVVSMDDGVVTAFVNAGVHGFFNFVEYFQGDTPETRQRVLMLSDTLRLMSEDVRAVVVTDGERSLQIYGDVANETVESETAEPAVDSNDGELKSGCDEMSDDTNKISYYTRIEYIDAQRAEELLKHNYDGNRKQRKAYIEQLAQVMRQGRFVSENGQTIVVGADDGVLYDGQHRLAAIVLSGKGYYFIVAYIVEGKEKYKTMDGGTKRSASDFIQLPNKTDCAALAGIMAPLEWGSAQYLSCLQSRWTSNSKTDRGMIVLYCDQNPDFVSETVRKARSMARAILCGSTKMYSTFLGTVSYLMPEHKDDLDRFVDDFIKIAPSNKTVVACKSVISKAYVSSKGTPELKWMVGTLLDAFFHFVKNDSSTMLNHQQARIENVQKLLEEKRAERGETNANVA